MKTGQAAALAAAFTGTWLAAVSVGAVSLGALGGAAPAFAAGAVLAPETSPVPRSRPGGAAAVAQPPLADARPMLRPVPSAPADSAAVPVLRQPAPRPVAAAPARAVPPVRPVPAAEGPQAAAVVPLAAPEAAGPADAAEVLAALYPLAAEAEASADPRAPAPARVAVALPAAEAPSARAGGEPLPRVAAPGARDPRPQPRPLPEAGAPRPSGPDAPGADAVVPARATSATMALAARPDLRPAPRPAVLAQPPAPLTAALSASAAVSPLAVAVSRLPRVRPEDERRRFLQRASAARPAPTAPPAATTTGRASGNLCGVAGLAGRTIPPVTSRVQGCGVAQPVQVTAVDGVRLSQAATMDCDTARALHSWVRTGLRPAVGSLGGGPAELRVAGHYVCRTQNHRPGARISEHGRGRAIDISGVRLADGRTMSILQHWRHATYGPVLRAAHRAACGTFSTTLGPGSDGMHEDHLHFDLRRGRQLCR